MIKGEVTEQVKTFTCLETLLAGRREEESEQSLVNYNRNKWSVKGFCKINQEGTTADIS